MIEVKNVVKTFDGFAALNDATISVPTGAVYGLVGPNGAGKSTIIRHLTGIFRQDSGTVRLGGEDVWENAALKAKIAAIPDDWYYFNSAGIGDMMRFYKGFYPNFSTERYEKLREVFELDEKRPIRRFSKGMQKQAAFWLALSAMPDYLILDEPTASLNEDDSQALLDLLLKFKKEGMTSIIISHKLNEISYVADKITVIRDGSTIETLDKEKDDISEARIIKGMVGRELTDRFPKRENKKFGEINLETKDWTVYHPLYTERKVVDNVSINVRKGEVVGIRACHELIR